MSEQKHEQLTFAKLALALAGDYTTLYVINPDDDSYVEYSSNDVEGGLNLVSSGSNFYEAVPGNTRELVWPEDQEFFLEAFKKEAVVAALNEGKSFSLTYRLTIDGIPVYHYLKTIRSVDNSIIIGVRNIDAQKRKKLQKEAAIRTYNKIAESLASLFEVIYHVTLRITPICSTAPAKAIQSSAFRAAARIFSKKQSTISI